MTQEPRTGNWFIAKMFCKAIGLKMVGHSRRRQPSSGRQPSQKILVKEDMFWIPKLFQPSL